MGIPTPDTIRTRAGVASGPHIWGGPLGLRRLSSGRAGRIGRFGLGGPSLIVMTLSREPLRKKTQYESDVARTATRH